VGARCRLVVRVERFISAAFHWHRAGSARETLEALARSVQQGAVYVVQEDMPVSGGYVASGKRNTSWLGAAEEASSAMSFKEHYLAQLERMNADRPTWAEIRAMMDSLNADFMTRMAGPARRCLMQCFAWPDGRTNTQIPLAARRRCWAMRNHSNVHRWTRAGWAALLTLRKHPTTVSRGRGTRIPVVVRCGSMHPVA
jgi:hypothetical protein